MTNKKKTVLILQTVVWILLAAALAAAAVVLFADGSARKAENPMESIYTPKAVAEKLTLIAPLFFCAVGLTVLGLVLGVRDENAGKPVKMRMKPAKTQVKHKGLVQAVLVVAAAALILAGILNGSARDVLIKAITICSECIGLG